MIFPRDFADRISNPGEKLIYNQLDCAFGQDERTDVYYSRRIRGKEKGERRDYELDFIVIDRSRAVLFLEVKGGLIEYDGAQWLQNKKSMKKGPDNQVRSAASSFLKRYPELEHDLAWETLLVFPDTEILKGKQLPDRVKRALLVDSDDVENLGERIQKTLDDVKTSAPNRSGMEKGVYKTFRASQMRRLGCISRLGTRIGREDPVIETMTEEQWDLFCSFSTDANKKMVVSGPAGTGKTVLAENAARTFSEHGLDVLLLCHNDLLEKQLGYRLRDWRKVKVQNFSSFAKHRIEEYDADWWGQQDATAEKFWNEKVPYKFSEIPSIKLPHYDAIIVDEGQDFKPDWIENLAMCLSEEGRFYVFVDPRQDIFNHYKELPKKLGFFQYPLTKVCRNTKNIVKFLESVIGAKLRTFKGGPEGSKVVLRRYKTQNEQREMLVEDVEGLLGSDKLRPEQLLILQNRPKRESCIKDLRKIGRSPLEALGRRTSPGKIPFTSIRRFKGLEADVVLILDIDAIPAEEIATFLYTEGSRAKHKLFIYRKA